ncbi:hypothetical protein ACFCX4_35615 [Kitasatospora sp. NPDC056327]|uniref:hypothetical protein n=1 Tax=Kitasatospora sp. NPDC056327 TaxID=3345785 RepID=UPI0035DC57C2
MAKHSTNGTARIRLAVAGLGLGALLALGAAGTAMADGPAAGPAAGPGATAPTVTPTPTPTATPTDGTGHGDWNSTGS